MKNFFFYWIGISFIASCFCLSLFADTNTVLDEVSSQINYEQNFKNTLIQESEEQFSIYIGLQQISGFIVSADHIRRFFLRGIYRFKKSWFFSLDQAIDHRAFINPNSNDRGVWWQDTALSINKQFTVFKYHQLTTNLSASLPFSYDSGRTSSVTDVTLNFEWGLDLKPLLNLRSEWIQNVVFFVQPALRYYFFLYSTTPTENQSMGGRVLPEWLLGVRRIGLNVVFNDRFSLRGGGGRWFIFPYNTGYERDESNFYKEQKFQRHYYEFFLSGSWNINKQWSLSLSYTHNDRIDKLGRREILLLDDRISTWSVSTSYLFSF